LLRHASQILGLLACFPGFASTMQALAASCLGLLSHVQIGAERIRQHQHRAILWPLDLDVNDATVVGFDIRHFLLPVFPGRGAARRSAFTRVFDAQWVHRRSGIVPASETAKVPVQQRTISCCAAPGTHPELL
jgi:hypothetical protein